ncbi:hypothetical protein DU508_00755 [Pedobacter chinensis]|uniref:Uncharacterized protein n=1 Tax=Pedobacter chinensis TaxID=2282421 RepID=A0A369Q245_9SPHI|nr:hypothetical protein DU508_00755 [Pedobacter chinensis]
MTTIDEKIITLIKIDHVKIRGFVILNKLKNLQAMENRLKLKYNKTPNRCGFCTFRLEILPASERQQLMEK